MRIDLLMPGFPAKTDHFLFGICSLILLRDGRRTILFDTGPFRVRAALIDALRSHGLTVEDVDTVFVSHLHWDHVENLDLFAHAEILVPRTEYEYAASPRPSDWGTPPFAHEILRGMRLTLLEEREEEIFPDMRTLLLPGHSIGLQGLQVKTEEELVVIASDAVWSARDAARGVPDVAFFDPPKAQHSLDKALSAGTLFYPGHDRPFRLSGGQVTHLGRYRYDLRFGLQPAGQDFGCVISTEAPGRQTGSGVAAGS